MIDPHAHSTASDGTTPPERLMHDAVAAGVTMLGLTDHDTVAGWEAAVAEIATSGTALIRGMELSAAYRGISLHMLAYLFDPASPQLTAHIQKVRSSRVDRAREIVRRLAADTPITWELVQSQTPQGATIGRPHIADALVVVGAIRNRSEAFDHYLNARGPYYVPYYAPEAAAAIGWIRAAGGQAVLAHPMAAARGRTIPLEAYDELAAAGLFGLEIDHRDNPPHAIPQLEAIAKRLGLARFGSSDYHGTGKPNRLGENVTAPEIIQELADASRLQILHP
ncbi:MAG: PHP domain-containing protein [Ancrocorticia sp.]